LRLRHWYSRAIYTLCVCCLAIMTSNSALAAHAGLSNTVTSHIRRYLIAGEAREVALARSAAPPSVSGHATIMVLESRGYVTAIKGTNGFVCIIARSWGDAVDVKSTAFWDPKFRAPYCFNPAAARSVLSRYLMRTRWVLEGSSKSEIGKLERRAWAAGKIEAPRPGAMSYMMSKGGVKSAERLDRGGRISCSIFPVLTHRAGAPTCPAIRSSPMPASTPPYSSFWYPFGPMGRRLPHTSESRSCRALLTADIRRDVTLAMLSANVHAGPVARHRDYRR
jgi:hypothetical protein